VAYKITATAVAVITRRRRDSTVELSRVGVALCVLHSQLFKNVGWLGSVGLLVRTSHLQWRTQDFRMGGVEVPQAPEGGEGGQWVSPSPLGEGSGLCPLPRKFFVFFVENTIFWRFLPRLFLKSYASGRGSNPLLGTPLRTCDREVASSTPAVALPGSLGQLNLPSLQGR